MEQFDFKHLFGQWSDSRIKTIDSWFDSVYWKGICARADDGCETCMDMMKFVQDMLDSLIFHLSNDSGDDRIEYELNQFANLLNSFKND